MLLALEFVQYKMHEEVKRKSNKSAGAASATSAERGCDRMQNINHGRPWNINVKH